MASNLLSATRVLGLFKGLTLGRQLSSPLFPIVAALKSTDVRPKSDEVKNAGISKSSDEPQTIEKTTDAKKSVKSSDVKKVDKALAVGDSVSVNKLVSVGDVNDFCEMAGDYNTVHTESRIVHGALLNALVSSVIGTMLPGPGTIVLSQTLNFPAACVAPQGIVVHVSITSARKIICCDFSCRTIDGLVVLTGDAKLMKKT